MPEPENSITKMAGPTTESRPKKETAHKRPRQFGIFSNDGWMQTEKEQNQPQFIFNSIRLGC